METEARNDAQLMASFCKGDARAFDLLVNRYKRPLFTWLCRQVSSRDDADDIFQETWIRVARNAGKFSDVSFRAWLWRIARNLVIDHFRRRREHVSLDAETSENGALRETLRAGDPLPHELMHADDTARIARAAIANLPPVQREVLTLRMQGGLSFNEIAALLEIPLNTALGRMHDAVLKIRKALEKEMNV